MLTAFIKGGMAEMKKKQNGFTLIELICVLAIISITAAIAVPNITEYVERSQKNNCRAAMHGIVDDIRYKCISKRFENEDTINNAIKGIISSDSYNRAVYSESISEDGHFKNSCSASEVCPNGGLYRFDWETAEGSGPESIILKFTYCCSCNKDKKNEEKIINVQLKEPYVIEYYDYLKSIAQIVYGYAQTEVKTQMDIGKTPSEITENCCGRLQADKESYIYRDGNSTDGIKIESLSSVAYVIEYDDLFDGTDDNIIWGMTVNKSGKIEWMCFHSRYKDIKGVLYDHYIVIKNGEIITTKNDYYNLKNMMDKESTPPIEGTLGSSSYKAEWTDQGGIEIGQQGERDSSQVSWSQYDSNWYLQD